MASALLRSKSRMMDDTAPAASSELASNESSSLSGALEGSLAFCAEGLRTDIGRIEYPEEAQRSSREDSRLPQHGENKAGDLSPWTPQPQDEAGDPSPKNPSVTLTPE